MLINPPQLYLLRKFKKKNGIVKAASSLAKGLWEAEWIENLWLARMLTQQNTRAQISGIYL